jgi:antitoxin (DNA-binding transcriptional repressor) of toxin-antitoxin stability system
MQTLSDTISLFGKFEEITQTEFRQMYGEVVKQVELGKTYLITSRGKPVAVLSQVPGQQLTIKIGPNGERSYHL